MSHVVHLRHGRYACISDTFNNLSEWRDAFKQRKGISILPGYLSQLSFFNSSIVFILLIFQMCLSTTAGRHIRKTFFFDNTNWLVSIWGIVVRVPEQRNSLRGSNLNTQFRINFSSWSYWESDPEHHFMPTTQIPAILRLTNWIWNFGRYFYIHSPSWNLFTALNNGKPLIKKTFAGPPLPAERVQSPETGTDARPPRSR